MRGTRIDQNQWPFPSRQPFEGRYMSLALLSEAHVSDLWIHAATAPTSFDYLRYGPFADKSVLTALIKDLSNRADQPFWAVLDVNGRACGWLSICDVSQEDGAFEIGSIWFAPCLQGTRAAREAIFVLMRYGMDDLGYERLVWRCQTQNEASFKAAVNLGFTHEGTWRNAAVVKGWQRDVAWFSILKSEWPAKRDAFEA